MKKKRKLQYLVSLSKTNEKLDAQKIAKIIPLLTKNELKGYYTALMKEHEDETVTVSTVLDVPSDVAGQLKEIFKNKDLVFVKDPSIIAGLKVSFSDFIYDGTFKSFLDKLKGDEN